MHPVTVLFGPTASGKSAAALQLAQKRPSVIINADAMQCYAALPILTAQPTPVEQEEAPHKLYGFVNPAENMVVTDWRTYALAAIEAALAENRHPILVGGTGFYLKVLMEGLSPIPDIPPEVRTRAEQIWKTEGLERLAEEVRTAMSAEEFAHLDRQNPRRVVRAWEVWKHTGRTLSDWQKTPPEDVPSHLQFNVRLITRPREELIARINQRFDAMLEKNVLQEVAQLGALIESGAVSPDNLIVKAHGFRALWAHVQGRVSLEEAAEQAKIETRQYAKRQMTWARTQFEVGV
ncbi:MAG: tRNA (adenosine(37)-N6)-dimethylallyltransferase MiaA [Rhodospirillales bacterium]|nr:tRNA (adenosine(37)-N6)-dimethylallyltransferase MiaA [Rhodospirillales bacterium]